MLALLLLPPVAAGGLWVRSYWRWTASTQRIFGVYANVVVSRGQLRIDTVPDAGTSGWVSWQDRSLEEDQGYLPPPDQTNLLGFHLETYDTFTGATGRVWVVPHWAVTGVTLLPFLFGRRWLRRAVPPGHCQSCGYDLRATPERCPECGRECGTAVKA